MKRAVRVSAVLMLLAAPVWAQESGSGPGSTMGVSATLPSNGGVDARGEPLPVVTLEWALKQSDDNQPNLRQARANTDAAYARKDEARAPLLPQVSGTLAYQRTTANQTFRPSYNSTATATTCTGTCTGTVCSNGSGTCAVATTTTPAASFRTFDYYQLNVQASQLIWDFGTTLGRFKSAEAAAAAQKGTELATVLTTHLTVRQAFFAARAQKALLEVARSTLANYEKHTQQIEGFVQVGTRAQIDLAQARTDQANARSQMINAENNYEIAKATLNQAMGIEQSTAYDVADESMNPLPQEDHAVKDQVNEAYSSRPEIEAQKQITLSDNELISSARGGYFPSIGVSAGYSDIGLEPDRLTWNFNAQAALTWNLFDGLGTPARVSEARANLVGAQAQMETLRLQIRLEVEQQRWAVRAAKESLVAAREAEVNARERLTLAEGRYQTGVGSIIELGDSQVASSTAQASRVQAEYNLASARAALLKALGGK